MGGMHREQEPHQLNRAPCARAFAHRARAHTCLPAWLMWLCASDTQRIERLPSAT
jgi:hypothetical protein